MESIKVKDIMKSRVVTASKNDNILDITKKMVEEDVGSVVIVESGKPIGIITREDVVTKVVAQEKIPIEVKADEIMASPVITCSQEEDINDVVKRMIKYDFMQMPVKDMDKLVGFISLKEILKTEPGLVDILREHLEAEHLIETEEEETISGDCELCGNFSENLRKINDRWVCEVCKDEAGEL